MTPLLELKDIRRSYPAGDEQVEVLKYPPSMPVLSGNSGCFAPRSYCNDWGWKTVQSITRHSFRVASNSASASRGH